MDLPAGVARLDRASAVPEGLLDHLEDVLLAWTPDGIIEWTSASLRSVLGYPPSDVVGTRLRVVLADDEGAADLPVLEAALARADASNGPLQMRRSDGSVIWAEVKSRRVYSPEGSLQRVLACIRDVSRQVEAEREHRDAEERYRLTMVHSGIGMALVSAQGAFLEVNPSLCQLLGRDPASLLACAWQELTHPDDLTADESLLAQVVAGQRDSYRLRKRYLRPDGEVVWGDLTVVAVRDRAGAVRHLIAQIVDVTSFVLSEQRYRLLAENASDVVALSDPSGVIQWISPSVQRMLGWTAQELIGQSIFGLIHSDDVAGISAVQPALAPGEGVNVEARVRMASGDYRWVASHIQPVVDGEGRILGRVAGWRDVEEERATRMALERAEEHYRLLAENSTDVIGHARDRRIVWVSPSITAALGGHPDEWIGRDLADLVHPADIVHHFEGTRWRGMQAQGIYRARVRGADGAFHCVEVHTGPFLDRDGHEDGVQVAFRVVDDLVLAEEELEHRARFDGLTGLASRHEVLERLSAMSASGRRPGARTAALFCDLDCFKEINDRRGHRAGDAVLRALAERVTATIRQGDVAGRLGGDELLVILDGIHDAHEAWSVAEKIREAVREPIQLDSESVSVSVSIGVTLVHPDETVDELIARADRAMYAAKEEGRDRVVVLP